MHHWKLIVKCCWFRRNKQSLFDYKRPSKPADLHIEKHSHILTNNKLKMEGASLPPAPIFKR
jgi:hypothetical protein